MSDAFLGWYGVRASCLAPQEMGDGEVDELVKLQTRHVQALLGEI